MSDQSQQIVSGQLAPFHIRLRDSKLVTFAEWFCCVLAFSFVQINGTLNVAAFLLLLIGLGAWNLSRSVSGLVAAAPILVFSFFALASTVWSEVPNLTLRYSLQYVATAACSVIAARSLSPRSFLSALMLSTLVSLSLSLAFGEYKYDGVSRSFAFIGIFGSKNFLAFIVTIAIVLAVSATIDRAQPLVIRAFGVLTLIIAPLVLVRTHSATSFVTSALCAGIVIGLMVFRRLPGSIRAVLLMYSAALAAVCFAIWEDLKNLAEFFIQDVLGKDTTLTGRTYLWDKAGRLIEEHPLLGRGFQAFWRQESIEAEALWRYFQISGRGGFHFHNTYVQTAVDLGYVGAAVLVLTLIAILTCLLRWYIVDASVLPSVFLTLWCLLVIRSFVEVDITYQFQLGTIILYAMGLYSTTGPRSHSLAAER